MSFRQFEAGAVFKRLIDVLATHQFSTDQDSLAAQAGTLKQLLKEAYDLQATLNTDVLWNWGMSREDLHSEILRQLPDYDKGLLDGYSEQLYLFVLKQVPVDQDRPRKILEVGCGTGMGLNFLSRLEGRSTFVGLDLSQRAVDLANASFSRPGSLTYVQGDAEKLPFADGEFDVIINLESSHTYPNLRGFCHEVARVLRPGGFFSHVDLFTETRHELMEKCKQQTSGELDWIAETDISEYVREAIRRRMDPGSKMREHMARQLPFPVPSPLQNMWESLMMRGYGTDFLPENRAHWSRRISYFDSPGFQWVTKLTSYSHSLAKARSKGP